MSSSKPATPRNDRKQNNGRRHSHRSSGIQLPSMSPKVHHYPIDAENLPMDSPEIVEKFASLAESMETLDLHMHDLRHIHDHISNQFNESFASFLYGLSMTMWCVDFPGCPSREQWEALISKRERKERIEVLKKRLEDAQKLNDRLKLRLSDEAKQKPQQLPSHERLARGPTKQVYQQTRSVNFNTHLPDSITTNSHTSGDFNSNSRVSRIPQPSRSIPPSSRFKASSKSGPNLNQPPRYMRGLFDGNNTLNTSNYSRIKKPTHSRSVNSLQNRPPFR
ncbi:conserved hypothetical protein [Candida dubliniensis CD36]|uniref:DASH complex subunit DAM1 n=1 Tax=Candida dubliniensis (strain CD36 / ATCC MYA-646 / CBS 7987 / NCPF 3949 / NRRL Y-17841) TaxID=573826 RepID=B9W8Z1_CANDC|nr:conserved hypothetical protein [Candida dubliniensis CD36]CAX45216.1 conserved hypothetical protein [Candida dubliniensis CD36]